MAFKKVLFYFSSLGILIFLMLFSVEFKADTIDYDYVELTQNSGVGQITYSLGTKASQTDYIFDIKYKLNVSPPNLQNYKYIVVEGAYKDGSVYKRDFTTSGIPQAEYTIYKGTNRKYYTQTNIIDTEIETTTFEYFDLSNGGSYEWFTDYDSFWLSYYVGTQGNKDLSYWTNYWKNTVKVYATNNPIGLIDDRVGDLRLTYEDGYNDGFNFGYNKGYDDGFNEGWLQGKEHGENLGYDNGFNDGVSIENDIRPIFTQLLSLIGRVFTLEIFPGVTIGVLVSIPIAFGVFKWFLKIIS